MRVCPKCGHWNIGGGEYCSNCYAWLGQRPSVLRYVLIIGAALLLVGALAAGGWFYWQYHARKAAEARAREAVQQFAGTEEIILEHTDTYPHALGEMYEYTVEMPDGEKAIYDVDAKTGEVKNLFRLDQSARQVRIDATTALTLATTFAREHFADFDAMGFEMVQSELVDPGEDRDKYYLFVWRQADPQSGALLPNSVEIQINAENGQVNTYSAARAKVTVPTQPKIGEEEARRIALDVVREDLPGAQVEEIQLGVATVPILEPGGKQALLYKVVIKGAADASGYVPGFFVFIDAHTGQVIQVEPFA